MQYLSVQDSQSPIFKLKSIETIIEAQWWHFKSTHLKLQFIPFFIYFILIVIFSSMYNPHTYSLNHNLDIRHSIKKEHLTVSRVFLFNNITGLCVLAFSLYFIGLETLKFRQHATSSGLFQLLFHLLVAFCIILNFFEDMTFISKLGSIDYYLIVSSAVIVQAYFIFLLQLRIFEPFAVLINLIFYALKESATYIFIFMFAVAGFANALFILAMIESPDTSHHKITGSNMFTSFMFAFGMHVYHNEHEELHYPVVFGLF